MDVDRDLELLTGGDTHMQSSTDAANPTGDLVQDEISRIGSLSPQLELLRLQGTDDLDDLYAEEEAAMLFDEPMSLPANFSSSGSFAAFRDASTSGGIASGGRPSSVPADGMLGIGDGPTTWPHPQAMLQLGVHASQPVSGGYTSDSRTARRLFALPRLPGSLSSFDDGQVAEEDSDKFRENLNHLNVGCVEKVGELDKLNGCAEPICVTACSHHSVYSGFLCGSLARREVFCLTKLAFGGLRFRRLTQELADATLALAQVEQRWVVRTQATHCCMTVCAIDKTHNHLCSNTLLL
jgi:hypothetical protein